MSQIGPRTGSIRTFVLRNNGLPLEERTVELGWKAVLVDDTPDRQAFFFTFDDPGVVVLRADASGKERRHTAPAADAITDRGPISAWIE
jgi:hypothetical protein